MEENSLKPLLVHLHLYYTDMWPEFAKYLSNLSDHNYDLYVTGVEISPKIQQDILSFKKDAKIIITSNRGHDVWPFLCVLNQVDLDKYCYIIKIHTKNTTPNTTIKMNKWSINRYWIRTLLIEALIGSKETIKQNLTNFEKDSKLGMIGSKYLLTSNPKNLIDVIDKIDTIANKIGIKDTSNKTYVSGTMFMARSSLFKIFQNKFKEQDFTLSEKTGSDGALSHILERVFCIAVSAAGYKIQGFDNRLDFEIASMILRIKRFFYQKKITEKGKKIIKICKIPVYIKQGVTQ